MQFALVQSIAYHLIQHLSFLYMPAAVDVSGIRGHTVSRFPRTMVLAEQTNKSADYRCVVTNTSAD